LLPKADVLLIALPLTEETEDLIGEEEIMLMPEGSILINIGRGPIVNQHALYDTLKSGHLHSAGSDGQRQAYLSTLRTMAKWVKKSQEGLAEKLSLHNFPTLVIRGEFDPLFSENNADSLIYAQTNAAKGMVHKSGHLPHQETPSAFLDAVSVWLKNHI